MQFFPLEDFMRWTSCCRSPPWLLLLSCYPLLHLAFLCCPRKFGPLQPLTTHDIVFSCLFRARYWIRCISMILDPLICDLQFCTSPLSLISNATDMTRFGFFKAELCLISHNGLIMDQFSRANFYVLPHVIVFSFSSKIYANKYKIHEISAIFYIIPISFLERKS